MAKGQAVKAGGRPPSTAPRPRGDIRSKAALGKEPMRAPHAGMPRSAPLTAELSKKLAQHPAQAPRIRDAQARKEKAR